jgi:hypothetical protein
MGLEIYLVISMRWREVWKEPVARRNDAYGPEFVSQIAVENIGCSEKKGLT